MNTPPTPGFAAKTAIAAIVLLGMVGGSLIVAHSGFETSPRRGGPSVFVPAPQAYLLAATLYAMSVIGLLALVWGQRKSIAVAALAIFLYAVAAVILVLAMGSV